MILKYMILKYTILKYMILKYMLVQAANTGNTEKNNTENPTDDHESQGFQFFNEWNEQHQWIMLFQSIRQEIKYSDWDFSKRWMVNYNLNEAASFKFMI